MDFVAYGGDGLFATEVKRSRTVRRGDLHGLKQFKTDYPMARCLLLFGSDRREYRDGIQLLPVADALGDPTSMLASPHDTPRPGSHDVSTSGVRGPSPGDSGFSSPSPARAA